MAVPILKLQANLIASVQSELSDAEWDQFSEALVRRVAKERSSGVIIDVTALDTLDSFATRILRNIAQMLRLKGAAPVIVGIQSDVAFAMAQLGLTQRLATFETGLDLQHGLQILEQHRTGSRRGG